MQRYVHRLAHIDTYVGICLISIASVKIDAVV